MSALALRGGAPVRAEPLPGWPSPDPAAIAPLVDLVSRAPWALSQPGAPPGGHFKARLEASFAALCGTRFALAVSSGTTALDLALDALGLAPGGVVVAANYGHPSTIRRAAQAHRLRLLDVDAGTLCLDVGETARVLDGDDVRCVITTHFAGQPGGVQTLRALCRAAGVPLLEDASHAHGARVHGAAAGSFGTLGCFSLHATKVVTAGEGGMITTDDETLFRHLWRAHDLGRDRGAGPYAFETLEGNYRMSEVHALLAAATLAALPEQMRRRMSSAAMVRQAWHDAAPLEPLAVEPGVEAHAYAMLVARYRPERCGGLSRRRFVLALCAEGIACDEGWPSVLSRLPAIRPHCEPHPTPIAASAVTETVWFDHRLLLADEGARQIIDAVEKVRAHAHEIARPH